MANDSLAGHSILIVDDNPTLTTTYKDFLTEQGMTVHVAVNGAEGLKLAKETNPSVILLDLMMPEMDGLSMLRKLKADETLKQIPVIVFTALVEDLEKQDSLAAGAVEYLEKIEIEPNQLVQKLEKLLAKHG